MLIMIPGITFRNFIFNTSIDLHNKTLNKVNFQAIDAVVNEKLKVVRVLL